VPGTFSPGAIPLDLSVAADAGYLNYSVNSSGTTDWTGGGSSQTYYLTTGTDVFTATGSGDAYFNAYDVAGSPTWTIGDQLTGNAGEDTFSVITAAAIANPFASSVTGIENVNMTTAATINLNATGFTGMTALNTTSVGAATISAGAGADITATTTLGTGTITVNGGNDITVTANSVSSEASAGAAGDVVVGNLTGAAGDVVVNYNGVLNAASASEYLGTIAVTGGDTVTINQTVDATSGTNNFTYTQAAVTVTGGATTESVTVSQANVVAASGTAVGIAAGAVTIVDANASSATAAGTIASVTLNNYFNSTIDSSALNTVTLSGTGGSLGLSRGALTATPSANTLTMNVAGLDATGAITDTEAGADDGFTTINIVTSGDASIIADLAAADATTLDISGSGDLTLTLAAIVGNAGMTRLQ
jgi:S-layer protein